MPLIEPNLTRASLVFRLRDRDDVDAWSDFTNNYGPMLYRFVLSRGLQDADALDLVQDVMRSVGVAIGRLEYQKEKGGFRAWLFTITRNRLATYFRKQNKIGVTANDTAQIELLKQHPACDIELSQNWDLEHQRKLAADAMRLLRPSIEPNTWAAFELTAIKGLSAADAGRQIGISTGAIYVARSRVTAKIRVEIQKRLDEES